MSERLELLRPTLSRYERRFTVLDLGAGINHPTLGYEIAQEFDAVVVEVEKDWQPAAGTGKRTIVLKHRFTVTDLEKLSECCHFDVVLAFNIVHWFESEWEAATKAILAMGDYVFVQIPTAADSEEAPGRMYVDEMAAYLQACAAHIGSTSQFPGHPPRPIYQHHNGVKTLTRTNWDAHPQSAEVVVYSTHRGIYAAMRHKTPKRFVEWIPGINLWNFCRLGGVVPSPERIGEMLTGVELPEEQHGDIQPWNMILDGERLHLIDGGDNWPGGDGDQVSLAKAIRKVEECLTRAH